MKTCISCRQEKPLADYYKHPAMADGHLGRCKECQRAAMKKNRLDSERAREYDRKRYQTRERREHVARVSTEWRERYPERYRAHTAVGNALRDGKLTKGPCEVCGDTTVHAHHDDYSKPLTVRWLCPLHHARHHQE